MLDQVLHGIAAGIGVALGLWWLARRGRRARKGLERLLSSEGGAAARRYLDAAILPRTELSYWSMMRQRERMAALALLGDTEALRREIAGHRGSLLSLARVHSVAYLGLCLNDSSGIEELRRLAERVEGEGGVVLSYVKKTTRALADLAEAVSTGELPARTRKLLGQMLQEGELCAALLRTGCLRVAERRGDPVEDARLRRLLGPWARSVAPLTSDPRPPEPEAR